jgi:hypothetical protein
MPIHESKTFLDMALVFFAASVILHIEEVSAVICKRSASI